MATELIRRNSRHSAMISAWRPALLFKDQEVCTARDPSACRMLGTFDRSLTAWLSRNPLDNLAACLVVRPRISSPHVLAPLRRSAQIRWDSRSCPWLACHLEVKPHTVSGEGMSILGLTSALQPERAHALFAPILQP